MPARGVIRASVPVVHGPLRVHADGSLPVDARRRVRGVRPRRRDERVHRRAVLHPRHHGQDDVVLGVHEPRNRPRVSPQVGGLELASEGPRAQLQVDHTDDMLVQYSRPERTSEGTSGEEGAKKLTSSNNAEGPGPGSGGSTPAVL